MGMQMRRNDRSKAVPPGAFGPKLNGLAMICSDHSKVREELGKQSGGWKPMEEVKDHSSNQTDSESNFFFNQKSVSFHALHSQSNLFTQPLATITNAVSWYANYVVIFSALTFGLDRAVMVVSLRSYSWFCNGVFKACVVFLTWMVPIMWVLPMFDPCFRSHYYKENIKLIEMERIQLRYVDVNDTLFYELYSYFFELGNIISPYILLCFFPNLRREFGRRLKLSCGNSIDEFVE
ncbi:hypothetical protein GCK32_011112 [Trichostrongylus colubriformis]|uniref:Uncharacterized protein n=1 Tax=Trichostrongylus colubriformis TaxID=6319 RepID=A0AAN8F1A0_TRICO